MTSESRFEVEERTQRLAVLIDADNAQAAVIEGLLAEVARFGEATVRRIYGDFTSSASGQWKKVLNKLAIKPVQQFAYTTGKNATDSMLIIDAMDLLYTRRFDGFCLVSSDSDFTGLALRIREEGLMVYGFGEQRTPEAFRNACHKFLFTEVLRPVPAPAVPAPASETPTRPASQRRKRQDGPSALALPDPPQPTSSSVASSGVASSGAAPAIAAPASSAGQAVAGGEIPRAFFLQALEQASDESGWALLSALGSYLTKLRPDFDSRNFGYKKLSDLVRAHAELFVTEERSAPGAKGRVLYVRAR